MATLEITTRIGCKVACSFCPQSKLTKAYGHGDRERVMSFEVFAACVAKLPREVNIDFAGMAEPWLNRDCTRMLLHAHERGHLIGVYTTLEGMTVDDILRIEAVPFRAFEVHLPSTVGSERITVDEHYLSVLAALRNSRIAANYHYFEMDVDPSVALLLPRHPSQRKKHTRAGNVAISGLALPSRTRNQGVLACRRKLDYNILLPSGEVVLCCMDYGMEHVLGNLLEGSYASLFQSPAFRHVEQGLSDESLQTLCRSCERHVYQPSPEEQLRNAALAASGVNPNLSPPNAPPVDDSVSRPVSR
jgi:hypothetical protein